MIKQPWLAAFLSLLLPGAGQIYAGKRMRGIAVILLCFCLFLATIACFSVFLLSDDDETSRHFFAFAIASVFLTLLVSIYSYFDSYKAARRYNAAFNIPTMGGVKKPWLAVFLSEIFPGIGQFYNRQVVKGILFVVIAGIILSLSGYIHYSLSFLVIPLHFYALKDAFESASKINGTTEAFLMTETKFIRVFVVAMIVLGAIPFGAIIRANIMQAYKIPSGSMLPTFAVGDHILIDKFSGARAEIGRGDLVVFKYPVDPSRDFIKRVIAVEGDVIESRNKVIYVNGSPLPEPYTRRTDTRINLRCPEGTPAFGNDQCHRDNFGPLTVPKRSVLVMGDNRDQSYDSRFWGYVPREYVIGKALKIYWSWDLKNSRIRWKRIGMKIK